MKYIEYARGAIPLHTLGPVLRGVPRYSKELIGKRYAALICIIENNILHWLNPREEFDSVAEHLFKILKDKKERSILNCIISLETKQRNMFPESLKMT